MNVFWHSKTRASLLALAVCFLGGGGPVVAASEAAVVEGSGFQWIDLRPQTELTAPYRSLWADKVSIAASKWAKGNPSGALLPAYTLTQTFPVSNPPLLVSYLFDMFDCEMPGNGDRADMYARCPLRLVSARQGLPSKVVTIDRVCLLYVPPPTAPGAGPDPKDNFTRITMSGNRELNIQVVQFGKRIASCDQKITLE